MNDSIKDFLIKIMSAFPHSFIKYYVYGGFEMILDEKKYALVFFRKNRK